MPRAKNPNREKAKELWLASGKKRKLKDIAAELEEPENTIRKWKSEDSWGSETLRKKKETERNEKKRSDKTKKREASVDKRLSDAVEKNEELTQQQKDFCLYFTRNRNAAQAYLKAYRCSYEVACASGSRLLGNVKVKDELRKLRDIKNAALGDLCGDDIVELHMRIAFSDITEYVEFSSKRSVSLRNGVPVYVNDPKTGEQKLLTHLENEVRIKDSCTVDGSLIAEVSEGRDGMKIKMADKQRSLRFLENYFELNPMDKHKRVFENARLDIEKRRLELLESGEDAEGEDTDETDAVIYGEE